MFLVERWSVVKNMMPWKTLPEKKEISVHFKKLHNIKFSRRIDLYHFSRADDFTRGVKPNLKRFLFLLMLTILNITRCNNLSKMNQNFIICAFRIQKKVYFTWSCFTLSTVKLNQNLKRGLPWQNNTKLRWNLFY